MPNKMIKVWAGGMLKSYLIGKNGEVKSKILSKNMFVGILKEDQFKDASVDYPVEAGD